MKAHDGTIVHLGARRHVGVPTACGVFTADDGWVWDLRGGGPLETPSAWAGTCGKVGNRFRGPRGRSRKDSGDTTARSRRTWPAGWRYGWTTAASNLSDHFLNQLRYWGIHPSFGFLEEPENQRGRRALESHAQGASRLRPGLSKSRRRTRGRRRVSSNATTSAGASRKLAYRTPLEAREEYELRHAA